MTCLLCEHETAPVIVNRVARNGTPQISVSCARCGFVQAQPMPTADDLRHYYESGRYRREVPALSSPEELGMRAEAEAAWLVRELCLPPTHGVMEVGCGEGRLSAALGRRGYTVQAWDMDPAMREAAASRGVHCYPSRPGDAFGKPRPWALIAMQVLEHSPDPLATLSEWHGWLRDGETLHVQVPTLEAMYGGAQHFFQWPHVTNWTRRTLAIALLRAGFSPRAILIDGTVMHATATRASEGVTYEQTVTMLASSMPDRDDVPALIAAHEATRPKPTALERWLRGEDVDARDEVRRLRDTLDLARESIAKLSTDLGAQSVVEGERWQADDFAFGYQCGKSRECGVLSVALGALANSLAVRESV